MALQYTSFTNLSRLDLSSRSKRSFPFLPGMFFILLGLVVLLAPRFFIAVLASMFFFVGVLFCYAAWKFLQLKRHLTNLTRDLDGKIQVQAFHVHKNDGEGGDDKKIVYH